MYTLNNEHQQQLAVGVPDVHTDHQQARHGGQRSIITYLVIIAK
jgi:hypothetical protein